MPIDPGPAVRFDTGLLSPVSVGADGLVSDDAIAAALVTAEVALAQALLTLDAAPAPVVGAIERAAGALAVDAAELAVAAAADGNPVGAVVARLRAAVGDPEAAAWVHRGTTSQDILDTAIAIVARRAVEAIGADLDRTIAALAELATRYRDIPAAARTLTQQAVPTTVGARFADWLLQLLDARDQLAERGLPAQLGGAAGTLSALVEEFGPELTMQLPAAFAHAAGLGAPAAPWHTRRTSITRLGDALADATDALGRIAADVATLSRTEIGELAEGAGGGSTAMPQKRNPVHSVLIRSAALRAPLLAAQLHLAAANAVDERPDGAWHAEWPSLRELLRIALGAAAHGALLVEGLTVDDVAVARNLAATGGLIVSERLVPALRPHLGAAEIRAIVARAARGEDLAALLAAEPALAGVEIAPLLDPANYTGLAGRLVDRAVARAANRRTP
ncbi:MAG TPA: lyase family protein [Microbacteriaceae bacterium]|nr:lyase family protein [Microbacteriaceae bacterium]